MNSTTKEAAAKSIQKKFDLKDRVAIITGGAGLLGVQHAEAIAEAGGIVVLMDYSEQNLSKATSYLADMFQEQIFGVRGDITEKKDIDHTLEIT